MSLPRHVRRTRSRSLGVVAAITVTMLVAALAPAGPPVPAHAQEGAGEFTGALPAGGGVALVIWNGGTIDQLAATAPTVASFWVTDGGDFVGYVPDAPAFVNADFLALFANGAIPAQTPMLLVIPRIAAGADFDQTGNLVRDNPGLEPGVWHLVYDLPGAPASTVALEFTSDSRCVEDGAPLACESLAVGLRARVQGEREEALVRVRTLTVEPEHAAATGTIQVFFLDQPRYVAAQEPYVTAVSRELTGGDAAAAALTALFAGPTPEEEADGLRLVASEATGAELLRVEDGIAHVELVGGCDSMGATFTVADEIIPTLTQLAAIDYVKIYDPTGQTADADGPGNSIPACLEP